MTACRDVIGYLDELLEPMAYDDYGPNGLQVAGRDEIESVATGVSANAELFTRAREAGVHLLAAGHYATETFGVRALGDRRAWRFGLRHVFIDVPNPV